MSYVMDPAMTKSKHPGSGEPILIAGAGPVGLFCALLLTQAGYRVVLLEKNAALAKDMRASTFHPATLDLFDPHGLAAALLARGSTAARWQYMIHGTQERAVFDLDVIGDLTAHPYRLQCEQFHFTELALAKLEDDPLFEMRFEHEVVRLQDQGTSVRIEAMSPAGLRSFTTPWLIAADGGKSTVRKQMELAFEGSVFPKTSITLVLDYPFQNDLPELLGVNYVWTDSGHYSLMQIRDLWRFSYSPDQDQSVEEALSEPVAQSHVQAVFPRREPYTLLQRNYYTLQQRSLDAFRVGRVLFAGDSAHLNSPAGGMGMNGGLHDAQCLAEHLLPVLDGEDDTLLDRYSRKRRTIALEEVQRLSARNYRRHRETDPQRRARIWRKLQKTVSDRESMRDFLLDSSMIRSRQREREID
jgi:3-(3-hydroxy-phenyl)propionate hydroxylase